MTRYRVVVVAKSQKSICSATCISWREPVTFCQMMMLPALYQTSTLNWICIVPANWNKSPRVDKPLYSGSLFCFADNQCVLLYLSIEYLAETQHMLILSLLVSPHQGLKPWSTAFESTVLTTDAVSMETMPPKCTLYLIE